LDEIDVKATKYQGHSGQRVGIHSDRMVLIGEMQKGMSGYRATKSKCL